MLHGRAGPYSSNDNATCTTVARGVASPCNAATLSKRHMMWGEFWAAHGYLALLPGRVSAGALAKVCGVPRTRIERIANEETAITADCIALRQGARHVGSGLNLQNDFDMKIAKSQIGKELDKIVPLNGRGGLEL